MTPEQSNHISGVLERLERNQAAMMTEISSIKRGVYGDEENEVPGLIPVTKVHASQIKSLQESRKKAVWWGMGFIAAIEAIWHYIKH